MELPNYQNSIVNLMSSISRALGKKSEYPELKILPSSELKRYKNIVLLVLDGVGYEYLKNKNSVLTQNCVGKITSVFPPTTASAITTFATGKAPQQHAFTGWFVYLKELGIVSKILPFSPRAGGPSFTKQKIKVKDVLDVKSLPKKTKGNSYTIVPKEIASSDFTKANAKRIRSYTNLNGLFAQIKKTIKADSSKKYIYAYWPEFDSLSHHYGINSKRTERHFKEINKKLMAFLKKIKQTNTILIITADHGLIDTPKERIIKLENHPLLKECLTLPFCGDARTVYCYVHPNKAKQFESYVKNRLNKFCWLYQSEELVNKHFFGLFKPNPKLKERIGDYTLIMKENYVFLDQILGEERNVHVGNHGGTSKEEMIVPLIIFRN